MKPLFKFAAVIAMLATSTTSFAQTQDDYVEPKNEVSVSFGQGAASAVISKMNSQIANQVAVPTVTCKDGYGVINFDYARHLNKWLAVGVNASFSLYEANDYYGHHNFTIGASHHMIKGTKYSEDFTENFTVMPTVKFNWYRRQHVSMYSRLSAGISFSHEERNYLDNTYPTETRNKVYFMGQVSPFGVEAGGSHVRAFSEVGFGQAGVVQAGVRFRF